MKNSVKQLILTALFLCVNSAAGLQCLDCYDSRCSFQTPMNCSRGETLCYTQLTEDWGTHWNMTQTHTQIDKGCASTQTCRSTGSHYVSFNTGTESHLSNITCCDTDNCNADNSTVSPPAGSLQCYGCSPRTYECTANVTCNAMETCFKAITDDGRPQHYGCVSENQCSNGNLPGRYFSQNTSLSCCNTSHCNAPEPRVQCLTCSDATCSSQHSTTCSTNMCYTYAYSSSNHSEIHKGCAPPNHLCAGLGSHFISYHLRNQIFFLNITCCDNNNCNTAEPSIAPPAGSLQCYSCDHFKNDCTHVTCNGLEVCSQATFGDMRFYGCVSTNLCYNFNLSSIFFGYNHEISCCNTTNCNVPPTHAPPMTHNPPFTTTPLTTTPHEDFSVFSAAGRLLPLGLPLSLLGLYSYVPHF